MLKSFFRNFLFLGFCLSSALCLAQRPLTNSRQKSYFLYLYKINAKDVKEFYLHPGKKFDEKNLINPIDSGKIGDRRDEHLPPGNYLEVYAEKNELKYSLIENHSAFLHTFSNGYDHRFVLTDKLGGIINNAIVWQNDKLLHIDPKDKTYHFKKVKNSVVIQADYAGVSNFYTIKEQGYDPENISGHGNFFHKIGSWFSRIFTKANKRFRMYPNPYSGFMTFNKPLYKPYDTVRFKAFILNKDKASVKQKQLLVEINSYNSPDKLLGSVKSYRDGGFEFSFVISDSLKMELDRIYTIKLVEPNITRNPGANKRRFYDEAGHKVLWTSNFRYEDYELKSITFNLRLDKTEHYTGEKQAVYLKATDENGLFVPDGRVHLTVISSGLTNYKSDHLFIPDTLWAHDQPLDPVGETKIALPDSIFPRANVSYYVSANFLDASNQSRSASSGANFICQRYHIQTKISGDTIKADFFEDNKNVSRPGVLTAYNADEDTITSAKVMLPLKTIVNQYVDHYELKTDSANAEYNLAENPDGAEIKLSATRTADSLFFKVDNPHNLQFWYAIYSGNKLEDEGVTKELFYRKAHTQDNVSAILVNYVWGGKSLFKYANTGYRSDQLKITVVQPTTVYPGQKVKTDILITDVDGKPVQNVDITAWAVTGKFENYYPANMPFTGKQYRSFLKPEKLFVTDNESVGHGAITLNWNRWSKQMGLDSIAYYQFTHTPAIYKQVEPGIDTVTQIAPFIVKNGDIIPVHILYIDEKPVFFSQAQQLQRYSFEVSPGKHRLRFRTSHQDVKLDSVDVPARHKLILGLNADYLPSKKLSDTLTEYEAGLLNKYMITIVNNFGDQQTYIEQNKALYPMPHNYTRNNEVLTGPLAFNTAAIHAADQKAVYFPVEPDFVYTFEPNLLKQKSILTKYPFNTRLSTGARFTDYTDYAMTCKIMDSLQNEYLYERNRSRPLFMADERYTSSVGKLIIEPYNDTKKSPQIKNVIVYRYSDPDFANIYPGETVNFQQLESGNYRLFFLMKDDSYDIKENIRINPDGTNFYKLKVTSAHLKDSVSTSISKIINSRTTMINGSDFQIDNDALKIKEAFNEKYLESSGFKNTVTGIVTDKNDKLPLRGVSVRIKGMNKGAVTDINGRFSLNAPTHGHLIISYVGYHTMEVAIKLGDVLKISLTPSANELQEVVVIGYGTQKRSDLTGAVTRINSELAGSVAGMYVEPGVPGSNVTISIRGLSSTPGNEPLYVVNGVIVNSMAGLSPADIRDISVLKSSAATALYGARAANGVVIITTSNNNTQGVATALVGQNEGNALRRNFSDYAYWQPKLTTDQNGKASFTATLPDDITNWRTFVAAISDKKQVGQTESNIKSFKPLSAALLTPQFVVEGDELVVLGKVTNYTSTPVNVLRKFSYNSRELKQNNIVVDNSIIDTVNVTAIKTDSISFEYTIKRDSVYFDGERRTIPVIKQGVTETVGAFAVLNSDTTLTLKFDAAKGPVTFHAESSVLPTLLEETRKLRDYKYLCNEQLASKLIGLLTEKRIRTFLGEKFLGDRNINDIIQKLQNNKKAQSLWGWWKDSEDELWISLHVVDALLEAQNAGYKASLDKQRVTDYLVYQLESYKGQDKLTYLQLLYKLGAKVDYIKYFAIIEKENLQKVGYLSDPVSEYEKLSLALLKQQNGLSVNIDSILNKQKHTLMGNIYWGEDNYKFFDNSIQVSLLAYQIIKNEGKHRNLLPKIIGYLLEQKKSGNWRNTYESASILQTILPELLVKDKQVTPPSLVIKGALNQTVNHFPYTTNFTGNDLTISKNGTLPVYITGYQQFWNAKPAKVNKEFTVNTWFEHKGAHLSKLTGGQAVELKAEITLKGDADYVMVEIPIPAGCSYESKEQSWANNEVHREHFKEKVSIFCRKLKQGKYTFSVNLMPRYNGKYNINPARAEMMYFPVFYGHEGMKMVEIGSLNSNLKN